MKRFIQYRDTIISIDVLKSVYVKDGGIAFCFENIGDTIDPFSSFFILGPNNILLDVFMRFRIWLRRNHLGIFDIEENIELSIEISNNDEPNFAQFTPE